MNKRVFLAPRKLTLRFDSQRRRLSPICAQAQSTAPRRGQALLLAVIVMLFIALISAGFLATVSGNLNQAASTSEKNRAIEAARAGLEYINKRINEEGENWRPVKDTTIPIVVGSTDYENYYTPLARAQGWIPYAYTRNDLLPPVTVSADESELSYVRFPDPRGTVNPDAPRFYARVERIGYSSTQRSDKNQQSEDNRAGALKITVIGLDKNNPNVFHRTVAYRGGYEGAPIGRVARAIGNFDFQNKIVPSATVAAAAVNDTTVTVSNVQGVLPLANFTLLVSEANGTNPRFINVISRVGNTLTTQPLASAIAANERAELAANLGAPTTISSYSGESPPSLALPQLLTSANTAPASVRANGSIYWQGNLKMEALRSKQDAFASGTEPRTIEASGLMAAETSVVADIAGTDIRTDSTDIPNTDSINALLTDGRNRVTGSIEETRQTKPYSPPNLASPENLRRYRGLTRDSRSAVAGAAAFGYGQGIYIDNIQDREKINDGGLREMRQNELVGLWLSTQTPALPYQRTGTPNTATTDSLEERHLRGWIARDEFRARGILIELFNENPTTPKIRITRDAFADGDVANTPNANKTWRDSAGNLVPGKYTEEREINGTDFNGVIFAEGNVRIKGVATGVDKSLTVVSMNNVYIEGSLWLNTATPTGAPGERKVLLLARKNVVVNPTSVISRPEAYTLANAVTTPNTDLSVREGRSFRVGDWITIGTQPEPVRVTAVAENVLTLSEPRTAALNDLVRIANEVVAPDANLAPNTARLATYNQVIQRRIEGDLSSGTRIGFKHGSIRRKVAEIDFELDTTTPVAPTSANMQIKGVAAGSEKINQSQKRLVVEQNAGTDSFDLFNVESLTALKTNMAVSTAAGATWRYDLQIEPGFEDVPPFLLAAVSNRRPGNSNQITHPWEQPLVGTGVNTELYLATSVSAGFANGATRSQIGTNEAAPNRVESFGFSYIALTPLPLTLNPTANSLNSENVASVDLSFYNAETDTNNPQRYVHQSELVSDIPTDTRTFAMRLNQYTGGIITAPQPLLTEAQIPPYHFKGMRLEGATPTDPGAILQINAFVYAQTGSWFVLPGDYYQNLLRSQAGGTYVDFNNNNTPDTGEFVDADASGDFSAGDFADSNRDGIADSLIQNLRYNYAIQFTGAIAENHTALVDEAVSEWMDKWSYPTTATGDWRPITYQFDSSYVTGQLEGEAGFEMPVSPDDILYQE